MFHFLLVSVVPEFDYCQEIYIFSTLQWQFQPLQDYAQILSAQLYVFLST
jgi:hypothetical protein